MGSSRSAAGRNDPLAALSGDRSDEIEVGVIVQDDRLERPDELVPILRVTRRVEPLLIYDETEGAREVRDRLREQRLPVGRIAITSDAVLSSAS